MKFQQSLTRSSQSIVGVVIVASAILAQVPAPRPTFDAFEVATIKPSDPNDQGGTFITMKGAHQFVVKNYSLKRLVGAAYDLTPGAISGGPAWAESRRYDILAATPSDGRPNLDEQMSMLRKLLEERFKLTFHREKKEFSVYALTVTKNGPKLKESTLPADEPAVLVNRIIGGRRVSLPARNATMAQFVSMMQRAVVDRPLQDKTGLSGKYDFDLNWTPDETQFGGAFRDIQPMAEYPDLFAAVQEQLGLKFEAARGLI